MKTRNSFYWNYKSFISITEVTLTCCAVNHIFVMVIVFLWRYYIFSPILFLLAVGVGIKKGSPSVFCEYYQGYL